jgi:hypothetical protein
MAMDADSQLRERVRPKSTLLDIKPAVSRTPSPDAEDDDGPELPAGERLVPLPQPGSPYDTAFARPDNKPLPTLHFVMGDTVRGFPYVNLDSIDLLPSGKPGGGPVIVIRFAGLAAREVKLTGRHLVGLYDLLSYHRVAWVRELPKGKDFTDKGQTVITGITIEPVKDFPA